MKVTIIQSTLGLLLVLTLLLANLVNIQAQGRTLYALQSRRGNEGVSVVVNVNINPHTKKRSATAFPVDETTKKVVSSFKEALTSKDEKEVAETYIEFADKIKNIADQVDQVKTPEGNELKEQLLAIVKDFTMKSEHPSVDILQSSLSDLSKLNENQPLKEEQPKQQEGGAVGPVSFETSGAKSLWIGQAISIASLGMNIVDGIGTYSDKISKVGKFLAGPVANKLDKWGLGGVAASAKKWGSSVDNFSQTKLKPIETKVAKKIAPVVKSKTFQAVRRTLNVVSGAISLKGGLTALGMVRNVKLPTSYKALKSSLTNATKFIKNRKQIMSTIRNTVANRKKIVKSAKTIAKTAGKNWKKMSTVGKLKNLNNFRAGYSSLKTGLSSNKSTTPKRSTKQGKSGNSGKSTQRRSGSNSSKSSKSASSRRSSSSRSANGRGSSSRASSGRSSSGRKSYPLKRPSPSPRRGK